ncbi:MAG: hypothetical protein ACJ8FY_00015 [Gemmataceae bacterium]
MEIEQALYGSNAGGGYRFLARSPGFQEEWLAEAERLCMGFGERPPGVVCPLALFVQPFGKKQVAIVRVADQGADDAGRPGALAFHLLVLPAGAYHDLGGDPFDLADRIPVIWHGRRELPSLSLPEDLPVRRTVAQIQTVLQRPDGPNLLGGSQALIDGGRLVFERSAPDSELIRGLWMLLPVSSRIRLWPATFAFGNSLAFHALITPRITEEHTGYIEEDQMGGYPEGRYELGVQAAAESSNQAELDRLFNRPGREQTLRLGLMILGFMIVLSLVMSFINPQPNRAAPAPKTEIPNLPAAEASPRLDAKEQAHLLQTLNRLASELDVAKSDDLESILKNIDERLGTPHVDRDPGRLEQYGSIDRQLRALLWKHHVPGYDDVRYKSEELVEKLERKVLPSQKGGRK